MHPSKSFSSSNETISIVRGLSLKLLPEIMRNQCNPFNFLQSLIFKKYVMNFVFAPKKKKAQTTIN